MERVLANKQPSAARSARRAAASGTVPGVAPASVALLAPGAAPGAWELLRPLPGGGPIGGGTLATRQTFASLEAAAVNLADAERFVLALPLSLGLVQRLTLPAADAAELEDMARIQLEKILPYPVESVSLTLTELARTETEVAVAVDTVHSEQLTAVCQPLVSRGAWPLRVVLHARALAEGVPAGETTAFLCREEGKSILGVCEHGKLGFAQGVTGQTAGEAAAELPAALLGAELEGVPTNFAVLSLDARAGDWADVLHAALNVPVEPFDAGRAGLLAAATARSGGAGDLSPPGWRAERLRGERMARLRRRLLAAMWIYLAVLVLAFIGVGALWLRLRWQQRDLAKLSQPAEYSEAASNHWRALAPAVDPSRYLTETMREVYECLPTDSSVLWTIFDLTPRTLSIQGEAPSPSAAVDFTDKLKARPGLRMYHFEAEPPAPLANGRARFHITGTVGER